MSEPLSVAEQEERWKAVLKAKSLLLLEEARLAAAAAAVAAVAETRGTRKSRPTPTQRGLDRDTRDGALTDRLFQKPREPSRLPNRLDKLKRLLSPSPPLDNEEQRKADALKGIENARKNSSGESTDPRETHTIKTPSVDF
jgi:hypothetical protein